MKTWKAVWLCLLTGFAFMSLPVSATIATLNTGDSVIFNFDATSFVPYSSIELDFSSSGLVLGESVSVAFFTGLDGNGSLVHSFSGALVSVSVTDVAPNPVGLYDGLFSAVVTDIVGSYNVDVWAVLTSGGVQTRVDPALVPAVPEPTTLALLGLGLAGIGFSRHRKSN